MPKALIIGQGIAGTLLAWELRKSGVDVLMQDGNLPGASSIAAAGIINPVTGKRYVKSWRFEEFYPIARQVYRSLEEALGVALWEERPILRLLATPEETNDWSVRCSQEDYLPFLSERDHADKWGPLLKPGFHFGLIHQSGRVNLPLLTERFRNYALEHGFFQEKTVAMAEIEALTTQYDQIIFCEGWRGETNPFFPETPFRVSKGEALLLRFPGLSADEWPDEMLKKTVLVAPLGDGLFWAGSTYRWHFPDTLPGEDGRSFLLDHLHEMLSVPFDIIDMVAGIRPTMIDRRPVVKQSLLNPKVYMFNGLGTKGTLLAPFFARELATRLVHS
ncbi:MAG TPA: FAD-dependent oxidoreductase [Saprospiraceae bacterium]|nr:FAD-dependent oxidoreductase [Saprospiraceae bacterium]